MKKLIICLALSLGISYAYAQNGKDGEDGDEQKVKAADVPMAVRTAFKEKYPQVKDSKWEKEGANYEAEFEVNKAETAVVIDGSGKIIETETEIAINTLPKAVTDYVAKNLSGKKIKEAAKITDHAGKISYEAEVGDKDYIFDANGTFIKEEKE